MISVRHIAESLHETWAKPALASLSGATSAPVIPRQRKQGDVTSV
jgi:hypothetical protein